MSTSSRTAVICMLALAACAPAARGAGVLIAIRPALQQTLYLVESQPSSGWLGIRFTEDKGTATPSMHSLRVRVVEVVPHTPAHKADLRAGDVILTYRNEEVTFRGFPLRIAATPPGTAVAMTVLRGDTLLELRPVIGDRRNIRIPGPMDSEVVGMRVLRAERIVPGVPRRGLFVESVRPGSPADRAGLAPGTFVIAAHNVPLDSAERLRLTIASQPPGSRIVLLTQSDGQLDFYVLISR